ncbi:MAG: ribonuclease J [Myxococcales bacterium]|nr:ribonuclease J [Myxococcales bacterium]
MLVIPVGGCGEFGKNLTAYVAGSVLVFADCGIQMPDDVTPGIEHILPDFDAVISRYGPPSAVLLTHGHEDHIGALGYLLRRLGWAVPVYGRPLTLRLCERRLDKLGIASRLRDLRELVANRPVFFGWGSDAPASDDAELPIAQEVDGEQAVMKVTPLSVPHSIPEACALLIESLGPDGRRVLHTGDFKLDEMGEFAFAELARRPVDVLVGDSTNAQVAGKTPHERTASDALSALLADPTRRGRIVVALFSSHLERVARLARACQTAGRKLCLVGRGLHDAVAAAERARVFSLPADVLVSAEQACALPAERVAILCTGTQGERMAALGRLVAALDRGTPAAFGGLRLSAGDTVVVAARIIPGHERQVGRLLDRLVLANIEVLTGGPYAVSGHGSQDDLRALMAAAQPRMVVPVHGTPRQIYAHAALAESLGIPALRCRNGDVISVDDDIAITDNIEPEPRIVDGNTVGEVGPYTLRMRLRLSYSGVVVVAADPLSPGRLLVRTVGVRDPGQGLEELCSEAASQASLLLRDAHGSSPTRWATLPEETRRLVARTVRNTFLRRRGAKPTVLTVLPGDDFRYDEDPDPLDAAAD